MNLQKVRLGNCCRVTDIRIEEKIMRRLEALGILEGTRIEVLNRKKSGAVIIKVRGARWALGDRIARGIEVEEWQDE